MPSLKSLTRKIASLKSTRKITKAMKMIAFTRYRKAQQAAHDARAYGKEVEDLAALLSSNSEANHPLMKVREVKHVTFVLFTTERGLCGALNANLAARAYADALELSKKGVAIHLLFCGKKGQEYFKKKGLVSTVELYPSPKKPEYGISEDLAQKLTDRFLKGETDEVHLAWNECRSVIRLVPTITHLMPVRPKADSEHVDVIIEPDMEAVLDGAIRERIVFGVHHAWQNSAASEHAARMTAMDNATNNAGTLIDQTTLVRNRLRQAAITKELLEITAGVESMKA